MPFSPIAHLLERYHIDLAWNMPPPPSPRRWFRRHNCDATSGSIKGSIAPLRLADPRYSRTDRPLFVRIRCWCFAIAVP